MTVPTLLLCGATGNLGGSIARSLARSGVAFRALVRPGRDAAPLEALGAEIARGDFRDPESLGPAMAGITTVVSTVSSIGAKDVSFHEVDDRGYANAIAAAEAAGVGRFVFVSVLSDIEHAGTPFTDAKRATAARLRASPIREVIVRPDAFQEGWLGAGGGFDLPHGKATIYGQGRASHRFIATDDVAEAVVHLALAEDPPASIDLVGPEAMTAEQAVRAYEAALGRPLQTRHIPRIAMRIGMVLTRPVKPELSSVMGLALFLDTHPTTVDDGPIRALGISPRPASAYIEQVAGAVR